MAYQERENLLGRAMTLVQNKFNHFKEQNLDKSETVAFSTIGGDFNCDNMSPGKQTKK